MISQHASMEINPGTMEDFFKIKRENIQYPLDLGLPSPAMLLFSLEDARRINLKTALQYSAPCQSLKEKIIKILQVRGEQFIPENILLCNGSQEGLFLLAMLLLKGGKKAIVEEFSYPNFHLITKHLGSTVVSVKTDKDNTIDIIHLEKVLAENRDIGCIYIVPNGNNPSGGSLSLAKKKRIAELGEQYRIPIIEDDPYAFVSFDGMFNPSIKSMSQGEVYYVGTFSKLLGPSLRAGWIIGSPEKIEILANYKESINLNVLCFSHLLLDSFISEGSLLMQIEKVGPYYRRKRDLMIDAIEKYFPSNKTYSVPSHGFFIWLGMPGFDSSRKLDFALKQLNVSYIPGKLFSIDGKSGHEFMRLSFSGIEASEIDNAIAKLALLF